MQEAFDPASVRLELDRILESPEFSTEESLLEEALDWLLRRLGGGEVGVGSRLLYWVFAILVTGLLLFLAWRLIRVALVSRARLRATQGEPELSRKDRVRRLRIEAREAVHAGELQRALRLCFFALVSGLGDRGDLRYRDAWTYREILRRGEPSPDVRDMLDGLVRELEAKEYGREATAVQDVARLEQLCERYLGALESGGTS